MPRNAPKATDIHVGLRIRARRMELRMSQEALAAALGITFQQVQKYEKGTNRVGASRLQDIARALKTSISSFFEEAITKEQENVCHFIDRFLADRSGIKIARTFADMSDWQRKALLAVAETLSQHSSKEGE